MPTAQELFARNTASGAQQGAAQFFEEENAKIKAAQVASAKAATAELKMTANWAKTFTPGPDVNPDEYNSPEQRKARYNSMLIQMQEASPEKKVSEQAKLFAKNLADLNAKMAQNRANMINSAMVGRKFSLSKAMLLSQPDAPKGAFTGYMEEVNTDFKQKQGQAEVKRVMAKARQQAGEGASDASIFDIASGIFMGMGKEKNANTMREQSLKLKRESRSVEEQGSKKRSEARSIDEGVRSEARLGLSQASGRRDETRLGLAQDANRLANESADRDKERLALQTKTNQRQSPTGLEAAAEAKAIGSAKGAHNAPVSAADLKFLGMDPATKVSENDLIIKHGRTNPDPKTKIMLKGKEAQLRNAMETIRNIITRVENNPKVLGAPSFVSRSLTTLQRNMQGFMDLSPSLSKYIHSTGAPKAIERGLSGLTDASVEGQRIKSLMESLTYQAGALVGQTDNRFSDKDYEAMARQIGAATTNDKIMVGVLRSFAIAQHRTFNDEFFTHTGGRKFVGITSSEANAPFKGLDDEQLSGVVYQILPDGMYKRYKDVIAQRLSGKGVN